MLCRCPAYVGPGLPSPTTSHTSDVSSVSRSDGLPAPVRANSRPSEPPEPGEDHSPRSLGCSSPASALGLGDRPRRTRRARCRPRPRPPPARPRPPRRLRLGDVDDQRLGVEQQRRARGEREVGGEDLGAGRRGPRCRPRCTRGCGWPRPRAGWSVVLGDDQRVGGGLAVEVDGHVDGDLLALADGDEVDVLEDAPDRVDLDLLGQRELGRAVDVELEQGVRRRRA